MSSQPCILGTARLGNFRLGYTKRMADLAASQIRITLAGLDVRTRVAGLTIRDVLNDAPNTCMLTIDGVERPVGEQELRITLNRDDPQLLFNGNLQTIDMSYEGWPPTQRVYPCNAVDDTFQANRRRPFGTWVNVSATTYAQQLIAQFAPGFTTVHVAAGLPPVTITLDGTEGMSAALKQAATQIGGYFYFEDGDLHLFLTEAIATPDPIDGSPGRLLAEPPIRVARDDSQLRTRQCGRAHGEGLLANVAAGETILPIENAGAWFGTVAAGGKAIALSQRLTYTSVQNPVGGALVGPGAGPSVAPTVTLAAGAGLASGAYNYAYTFTSATGESLPSPLAAITTGNVNVGFIPDPTTAPQLDQFITGNPDYSLGYLTRSPHGYYVAVTFINAVGETACGPFMLADMTGYTFPAHFSIKNIPVGPSGTTNKAIYWYQNSENGPGGAFQQVVYRDVIANSATTWVPPASPTFYGSTYRTTNTTGTATAYNQAAITGIALGPSGTTGRKLYRTAVNGSQLKLHTTIANNSATALGANDVTGDGSLGANAPTADTSGLGGSVVAGNVLAGSPTLLTSGAGPFAAAGGWALIGNNLAIRYTGISGNTLTGIPASGPGAILTTVIYGSQVVPAPALVGVSGVTASILKGTIVSVWVQRDDLTAQAAQAAVDTANGLTPADGIYEGPPIVDERRNEASMRALCDATLAIYSRPIVTVNYACRDVKSKSGATIVIDLDEPPIHETLTIQEVTITEIDIAPALLPRFAVTASSTRFSLDDIIRRLLSATDSVTSA